MTTINGKDVEILNGETISSLLARNGFPSGRIAVEINGDIIPKKKHETYEVKTDDRIEVVSLVGGG